MTYLSKYHKYVSKDPIPPSDTEKESWIFDLIKYDAHYISRSPSILFTSVYDASGSVAVPF